MQTEGSPKYTAASEERYGQFLEEALSHELRRIRRRFVLHGLAWMSAAVAVLVLVYFGLDRALRLPQAVRIIHSLVTVGLLALAFRAWILYPLTRAFTRLDVALAVEQRFPELRQQLVSALQLKDLLSPSEVDRLRNQSRSMIERVVTDAVAEARRLPLQQVL